MSAELNMDHFRELRKRTNERLSKIGTRHAHRQINEFPWLFGALGQVPSDVMFICENPSLTGVERAHVRGINGAPGIEDQWCGGVKSKCITRFRPALCNCGLKTAGPLDPGGWRCYITNVIKEADVVREFNRRDKRPIALEWADVLTWEIEKVSPKIVFTVGDSSTKLVEFLQRQGQLPASLNIHPLMHYANRGAGITNAVVYSAMVAGIKTGLASVQ